MRDLLFTVLGAAILGVMTLIGANRLGAFDFAADRPHADTLNTMIEWARERSIARAVADLNVPNITDPERIRRGAGNYDAMCVECHRAPGAEAMELHTGMYPAPPDLTEHAENTGGPVNPDARSFWIIKHGIKGSGMPAWGRVGMDDAAIWDLVAFVKTLPNATPSSYLAQVAGSAGHYHISIPEEESPAAALDGAESTATEPRLDPATPLVEAPDDSHAGHNHSHNH